MERNGNFFLRLLYTVKFLSYAWQKKERRRKKTNKTDIFVFGFLGLVKG